MRYVVTLLNAENRLVGYRQFRTLRSAQVWAARQPCKTAHLCDTSTDEISQLIP